MYNVYTHICFFICSVTNPLFVRKHFLRHQRARQSSCFLNKKTKIIFYLKSSEINSMNWIEISNFLSFAYLLWRIRRNIEFHMKCLKCEKLFTSFANDAFNNVCEQMLPNTGNWKNLQLMTLHSYFDLTFIIESMQAITSLYGDNHMTWHYSNEYKQYLFIEYEEEKNMQT